MKNLPKDPILCLLKDDTNSLLMTSDIDAQSSTKIKTPPESKVEKNHQSSHQLLEELGLNTVELEGWLMNHQGTPPTVIHQLLSMAKHLGLNPLPSHIDYEYRDEEGWVVFLTIDGWITLLHQQKDFSGIRFQEATEYINSIPIWMECSIYRSNLKHPITIREYYEEIKTHHPSWLKMPRRMLRHKTLQQCTRLAFSICGEMKVASLNHEHHGPKIKMTKDNAGEDRKEMLRMKLAPMKD